MSGGEAKKQNKTKQQKKPIKPAASKSQLSCSWQSWRFTAQGPGEGQPSHNLGISESLCTAQSIRPGSLLLFSIKAELTAGSKKVLSKDRRGCFAARTTARVGMFFCQLLLYLQAGGWIALSYERNSLTWTDGVAGCLTRLENWHLNYGDAFLLLLSCFWIQFRLSSEASNSNLPCRRSV